MLSLLLPVLVCSCAEGARKEKGRRWAVNQKENTKMSMKKLK